MYQLDRGILRKNDKLDLSLQWPILR